MRDAAPRTAAVLAALTILVCIVAFAGSEPIDATQAPPPPPQAEQQPPDLPDPVPDVEPAPDDLPEPEEEDEPSSGTPDWLRWLGLLLLVVAAALVARAVRRGLRHRGRRRRRRVVRVAAEEDEQAGEHAKETARQAIDAALVPLREPADAREAVIEAYVRMERVLAERALERQAPEAPREYLDRVLREQGMPERSLTALTELFEEARFSRHPVPDEAPARARSELEHARAALGVSAPS